MTEWFARVGLPLTTAENAAVGELVRVVAPHSPVAIEAIASWHEAARFVRMTAHDSAWWDDEEEERESLWLLAAEIHSEAELLRELGELTQGIAEEVRAAAFAAATAAGILDAAVAGEAAAMALLAAHQDALAQAAGAGPDHRFARKYALFTNGRWPLGYHSARFTVF